MRRVAAVVYAAESAILIGHSTAHRHCLPGRTQLALGGAPHSGGAAIPLRAQ